MGGKPNYALVGLFVVTLSFLMIVLIFWLTAFKHHESYNTYVIYMHEEISGLNLDAPVRYNGVKVGYVSSIRLNPNDPQQVILQLKVRTGTPITTSTIASLKSEGVTGVDYIGLKALTPQAPLLEKTLEEPYPVIPSEPSFLVKLGTTLQQITKTIKDVGDSIKKVLSPSNRHAVDEILGNAAHLSHDLAQGLPPLMTDTRVIANGLAVQVMPQAEQSMDRFNDLLLNIQTLIEELKRHPSSLIRGRYPMKKGPGEKESR